jgi:hypothetical protein
MVWAVILPTLIRLGPEDHFRSMICRFTQNRRRSAGYAVLVNLGYLYKEVIINAESELPQEESQNNDLTAKIDKAMEESSRLLRALEKGKYTQDQPIYALAGAFLQTYYDKIEKIMNDCLNNNATVQQFLEQIKMASEHHQLTTRNMLAKIKEIDNEIILRYIAEKTPSIQT